MSKMIHSREPVALKLIVSVSVVLPVASGVIDPHFLTLCSCLCK